MHCTICYFDKLIQYMALSEYNMHATFIHFTERLYKEFFIHLKNILVSYMFININCIKNR